MRQATGCGVPHQRLSALRPPHVFEGNRNEGEPGAFSNNTGDDAWLFDDETDQRDRSCEMAGLVPATLRCRGRVVIIERREMRAGWLRRISSRGRHPTASRVTHPDRLHSLRSLRRSTLPLQGRVAAARCSFTLSATSLLPGEAVLPLRSGHLRAGFVAHPAIEHAAQARRRPMAPPRTATAAAAPSRRRTAPVPCFAPGFTEVLVTGMLIR